MSNYTEIEKLFVSVFPDKLIHLAQEKGSKLRKHVTTKMVRGKAAHFDRIGVRTASLETSRHALTPLNDQPYSRRQVTLNTYVDGDMVDDDDVMKMNLDPMNDVITAIAMALGRKMDDLIIAAAVGNAVSTDETGATSNVALPAGQEVDEDTGTANSDINFAKVVEARKILVVNNVDLDSEKIVLVVDGVSEAALLAEAKFTGFEYGAQAVIESGRLQRLLGMDVVVCNRLTAQPRGANDFRALVFVPSAIGLAIGEDVKVHQEIAGDRSFNRRVMGKMSMGAVRIEDEKVVNIQCYR